MPANPKNADAPVGSTVPLTVTFTKFGQGHSGNATYWYDWNIDGTEHRVNNNNTFNYEIPPGDANAKSITVTCTVTEQQDSSISGTSNPMDFWQVQITLKRDGTEITGTPEVWAGERINVSMDIQPAVTELLNAAKQWSVGGRTVAGYTVTTTLGQAIPLSSAAMMNSALSFYWMQGLWNGVTYAITNTLTVNGTELLSVASFKVLCPEVQTPAQMGNTRLYIGWGIVYIELGSEDTPGFSVHPGLHGTFYHWIQTGAVECEWCVYKWGYPTLVTHTSSGLDTLVQRVVFTDSPMIWAPWWQTTYMSTLMQFKNYFAFKCNSDALYVPLQEVSWVWAASGESGTEGWGLSMSSRYCSAPVDFPAELPQWSGELVRGSL